MSSGVMGDVGPALPILVGGGMCLAPAFLVAALVAGWVVIRRRNHPPDDDES